MDESSQFNLRLSEIEWSDHQIPKLLNQFRELVVVESAQQNLTKLLSGNDFFDGHILDSLELQRSGWIDQPWLDWGTGGGIPGIPVQIISNQSYPAVLLDSEKRKADFVGAAIQKLGLKSTTAQWGRLEELKRVPPILVVRAVGATEKLLRLALVCSTWNKLILLKGPKFEEEWSHCFQIVKHARLKIARQHEYRVGKESKIRRLIEITRVPRGTLID